MIQKIRTSKTSKIIACYLAMMIFLEVAAPMQAYALTGGPSLPEFNSFTPIGTSDMVNLSSGDLNYNIPIMDVGGYPINLAYNSGVTMDQEASWVGLGWDLNVGQIARQVRGLPDDFDGDEMTYENNMKPNVTIGASFGPFVASNGQGEYKTVGSIEGGIDIRYNNYDGFGFALTSGVSMGVSDNFSVGMDLRSSASEGVTASPRVSFNSKSNMLVNNLGGNLGVAINSRKGIESLSYSVSKTFVKESVNKEYRADVGYGTTLSFTDASFTPSRRVGMSSNSFNFNMNVGYSTIGLEIGGKFSGYRAEQGYSESEKHKVEKAYGFENTYNASVKNILDFNRENDRTFTVNTASLPVTNNTYDLYSIQGQGIGGMFRPYKGQVGYVYDNYVEDQSTGGSLGAEYGWGPVPSSTKYGINTNIIRTESHTKLWEDSSNAILPWFKEKKTGNKPDYEKTYFKNIGGFTVDTEFEDVFMSELGGYDPVRIGIAGGKFSRETNPQFRKTESSGVVIPVNGAIKRNGRMKRNQAIQKLTNEEAEKFGLATEFSKHVKYNQKYKHHTGEIQITNDGGSRYVYGRAAYNTIKREVTFDVSGNLGNGHTGLVSYTPDSHNSIANSAKGDQYFNRVTTPPYAHTYLLTAVLSSDYSDLNNDGPTDDDLGSYTRFIYDDSKTVNSNYKWRIPYKKNHASYDEGLRSSEADNKGSYSYGEKELVYIKKIETKTHIAVFDISLRKDAYGVDSENGGGSASTTSRMYKLNKISLYSKPEYQALQENAVPIKVAHFVYDYSLCGNVENNFGGSAIMPNEIANQGGKLTLKKVYFTYRDSKMGIYTPYKFDYGYNPTYDIKAYDTWGNYKPNVSNSGLGLNDAITNPEFPYVEQNKTNADLYTSAWNLKTITLPSGGKIELEYESDDYQYVQDKKAMRMFMVRGVGKSSSPSTGERNNKILYTDYPGNSVDNSNYIYVDVDVNNTSDFLAKYLNEIKESSIYFRFLLNMHKPDAGNENRYDYVTGYLNLDLTSQINVVSTGTSSGIACLPIKLAHRGDGFNSGQKINPISLAGINFGRQYLNRYVYGNNNDQSTDDLEEVVMEILGSLTEISNIAKSPNKQLIENQIASKFVGGKSWIRLLNPNGKKLGGGSRVKQLTMYDQWDVMTNHDNNDNYKQYYGQQYTYQLTDGTSSGVATYEPLGNKENPLVQPFYDRNKADLPLGPKESNYVEMPFGECYFPAPTITYSRVKVKNLPREGFDESSNAIHVKKHATGEVVTEFFTSKDYPTIVDYTDMLSHYDKSNALASILNINVRNHLTVSQGFVVHTNDMNGKMKEQKVFGEGQIEPISGIKYYYENEQSIGDASYNRNQGKLDNVITTIDSKGNISENLVGVDYDVINDFRENQSKTISGGLHFNMKTDVVGTFPIISFTVFPSYSQNESLLRSAVTTKVVQSSGILRKQEAYDGGSRIYTKNLAWDAETGDVLLTEVINDFNDKYYSLNFPAYWSYDGMGTATKNLGLTWQLKRVNGTEGKYQFITTQYKAKDYLANGDEIWVTPDSGGTGFKAYVAEIDDYKATLITEEGVLVDGDLLDKGSFTVIRSGYRNMQTASMASVTTMNNPLYNGTTPKAKLYEGSAELFTKVINAAAIEYNDTWAAQCECMLPKMKFEEGELVFDYSNSYENNPYNPYKYNVKGNWRAKASYAYLTGRNTPSTTLRNNGFYTAYDYNSTNFLPFYTYDLTLNKWIVNAGNKDKWTYASEVSQYNPFGFEIENKDALDRYSSAIYGYNFRFPTAVAANTKYSELAFDSFEDYDFEDESCRNRSHFNFKKTITPNQVTISSEQSHSGRKSLKVEPNKSAVIEKRIVPCP